MWENERWKGTLLETEGGTHNWPIIGALVWERSALFCASQNLNRHLTSLRIEKKGEKNKRNDEGKRQR